MLATTVFLGCSKEEKEEKKLVTKKEQKAVLLEAGEYYLNSKTRIGGNERTFFPIIIPENTVGILYSVAVTEGGSPIKNLNLVSQVTSLLTGVGGLGNIASNIVSPSGTSGRAHVYLMYTLNDANSFAVVNDFKYDSGSSRINITKGTVHIPSYTFNIFKTLYIGIENPQWVTAENVSIEVVAIVEEEVQVYE